LSNDQKVKEITVIQAQLAKLDEMEKKAEANPFRSRVTAFIEAEKAERQEDMKRMIAEFAATYARAN
jgi:predicted secreted protein